jgi:tRNA-Thr(GGU) m(6)t(6)A37 methyltransferase TsaA
VIVGVVRCGRTDRAMTPVQAGLNPDEEAVVEIRPEWVEALAGLADFSHVWLLTWLRASAEPPRAPTRQTPFLLQQQGREVGTFAMRGPSRPTPIGLSLVRVLAVARDAVRFAGVDMVDGTPVLDIKPYVPAFDRPAGEVRAGWYDEIELATASTPTSLGRTEGEGDADGPA